MSQLRKQYGLFLIECGLAGNRTYRPVDVGCVDRRFKMLGDAGFGCSELMVLFDTCVGTIGVDSFGSVSKLVVRQRNGNRCAGNRCAGNR